MSSHKSLCDNVSNHKATSKKKKGKSSIPQSNESDSDQSLDANSMSAESQEPGRSPNAHKSTSKKGEWEILEGLKEGQRFEFVPRKFEGYLLKRRKWPLKGWHKRFFVVDQSILTYSKSAADLARGKKHGSMDIGMSVISTKARRRRIDIDADSNIFHLKCKSRELYMQWVELLKQHRLHKQHQILYSKKPSKLPDPSSPSDDSPTDPMITSGISSFPSSLHGTLTRDHKPSVSTAPGGGNLHFWLVDSSAIDNLGKEICGLQHHLSQLSKMIDNVDDVSQGEPATPSTKKRGKFRLRKSKSNKQSIHSSEQVLEKSSNLVPIDSVDTVVPPTLHLEGNLVDLRPLSSSNPALSLQSGVVTSSSRPHSCTDANSSLAASMPCHPPLSPSSTIVNTYHAPHISQQPPAISLDARFLPNDTSVREEFITQARLILNQMNSMIRCLLIEKEKAKQNVETESNLLNSHSANSIIATLRNSLNQALHQNAELRGRLARIHEDSSLPDASTAIPSAEMLHRALHTSLSYESSSCFSASEYFDAEDGASDAGASDTSSEVSSDNSSFTSDASDAGTDAHPSVAEMEGDNNCFTGRRTRLAVPKPPTEDFSPFKFLYKNIGKDLSKVCMPISINEPLNMLQRLCEELEYSELLDKAASLDDPAERMVQVAAFAVSAYASSIHRAAHKPFNPLLGETYECIREDKGFRFIAEQVHHHPPVSACYAHSNNFIFWQNLRIKTKFWGRSLEFQPSGTVHVNLPHHDDQYEWNKVTCCVHNLYGGGQRWVDQYGEMIIINRKNNLTCKLSFVKANSWSSKRHEVFGRILDEEGATLHNLFGKWTEALYCGHAPSARVVWRPGSMPEDSQLYYGFTRFAIELNELDEDYSKYLPPTDTRFRPDQRLLEEGNFLAAETIKQELEQQQRERRKEREEEGTSWAPMWFRQATLDGEETYFYNGEYWNKRKDPGFVNMSFERIF